jgi:DNA-binding NarL/FixJ family response regulator
MTAPAMAVPAALRVVIADDHPVVQQGLTLVLSEASDVDLVGTASDGLEAVALVAEHQPDVVIMDLHMPGLDGVAATRRITADWPAAVLVLTMHDDDDLLLAAIRAGARGYLLKGAASDEILAAIHAVARGEALFGAPVAQRLLDSVAGHAAPLLPELSARERQILELLVARCGTNEIARRLFLSPKTVRNNVSSILGKLHVSDRAQAIALARDAGLTLGSAMLTAEDPAV